MAWALRAKIQTIDCKFECETVSHHETKHLQPRLIFAMLEVIQCLDACNNPEGQLQIRSAWPELGNPRPAIWCWRELNKNCVAHMGPQVPLPT